MNIVIMNVKTLNVYHLVNLKLVANLILNVVVRMIVVEI